MINLNERKNHKILKNNYTFTTDDNFFFELSIQDLFIFNYKKYLETKSEKLNMIHKKIQIQKNFELAKINQKLTLLESISFIL